jgi:hypothetical protein
MTFFPGALARSCQSVCSNRPLAGKHGNRDEVIARFAEDRLLEFLPLLPNVIDLEWMNTDTPT